MNTTEHISDTTYKINTTLRAHRIPGTVVGHTYGPRVVRFFVEVTPGFKVKRLEDIKVEMAMALSVPSVLIQPVPEEGCMAVDVPRSTPEPVLYAQVAHETIPGLLPVMLGKGEEGQIISGDLADMPHLLIAGSTGSGKSVALNTILCNLIARRSPDQIQFVMIDPKRVELALYRDLPHLRQPIATDAEGALGLLTMLEITMNGRYQLLERAGVRNLAGYNLKVRSSKKLPFIVAVIDEMADLMLDPFYGKEIETVLVRLAQKARAAGIHLIAATQRPTVKVITGLIKTNFTTRIALRVPSGIDSKVILDQTGAEQLLGKGDMLYMAPGLNGMLRVQAPYTSDEEVSAVVEAARQTYNPLKRQVATFAWKIMRKPVMVAVGVLAVFALAHLI